MDFYIEGTTERTVSALTPACSSDGGMFQSELDNALEKQSDNSEECSGYFGCRSDPMVVISPKTEAKMRDDPEYCEELSKKLNELLHSRGKSAKDTVVIVSKNGEISQYCTRPKREEHPTAEELKEVAKTRARRKARLDAYFHLLERVAIKRKLIEQENAKRLRNKKYRYSVSGLDIEARTHQITTPPMNPDYYF